jgi:hypothetical protein
MSRIIFTEKPAHIGCMHLGESGVIGYHQAVVPQLLLIVNGEGLVRGDAEVFNKVECGDAVYWEKGLTAIVIECEELDTSFLRRL